MKPLAPKTEQLYRYALARAFGDADTRPTSVPSGISAWPASVRRILRMAIKWRWDDSGLIDGVPYAREVQREVQIPDEEELETYERAAEGIEPPGLRAVALLPLKLGMRAFEVCALERERVKRAVRTGELTFLRKGRRERTLPVAKLKHHLEALLAMPAKTPRRLDAEEGGTWETVGQILSAGGEKAQYRALWQLVSATGKRAGLDLHPHLLRHGFASRMDRDGASPFMIQRALDHGSIKTTERYIHTRLSDIDRFTRG